MRYALAALVSISILVFGCRNESERGDEASVPATVRSDVVESEVGYSPRLPTRTVYIDTFRIIAEIADNNASRTRGLMFREYLPDSAGMLFIFDEERPHSFWMKNTLIPLSIAFIAADSSITDIKWMRPGDLSNHTPSRPVLYALEMNRGWFLQRGIEPGNKVRF